MKPGLLQDYFTLFGIARRFGIDSAALEQAYRDLQSEVHPDRHAHLSETQRRLSMQWATHANQAYATLKNPLTRAVYLLSLEGVATDGESNTAMSPEFLMEQMEWREAVAEAKASADIDELDALQRKLRHQAAALAGQLEGALDERAEYDEAADCARRMMFIEKLQHDINDALEALES